jgi:ribose transport system permease protein
VIITAGIDLSIGSIVVFSQVVSAKAMGGISSDLTASLVGLGVALLGGAAWGLVNGVLVGKVRLPALIATLATLGAALGAGQVISQGSDIAEVPDGLALHIGLGVVLGIPVVTIIAAAVAVFAALLLAMTRFGRWTYAIGSSQAAARRAGVPVDRHLIRVYTLAGVLYGLAAYLSLAQFGSTDIGGHGSDALNAIVAVALGGTSLFGGVGTILGTIIGVFIPATLRNGLIIAGLQPYYQQIVVGAALAAAVYLDQARRRARQRGSR